MTDARGDTTHRSKDSFWLTVSRDIVCHGEKNLGSSGSIMVAESRGWDFLLLGVREYRKWGWAIQFKVHPPLPPGWFHLLKGSTASQMSVQTSEPVREISHSVFDHLP